MMSANVSDEDQRTAANLTLTAIRHSTPEVVKSLQELSIDHLGALSVSFGHILVKYKES